MNSDIFHFYYLEQAHYSWPYVSFKHCFPLSQAWVVSSANAPIGTKLNLWGHSLKISKVLSLGHFLPSITVLENFQALGFLFYLDSTWFLPVQEVNLEVSSARSSGNSMSHLICFLYLQNHLILLLSFQYHEGPCFMYLVSSPVFLDKRQIQSLFALSFLEV